MSRKSLVLALSVSASALVATSVMAFQKPGDEAPARGPSAESKAAAATYEDLATAIIAIEKTEDDLVKAILIGYHSAAQGHLGAASRDQANRKAHLEAAAAEVGNIANEGDAAIRAIRQRLAQAGHTHNTDVETKEDYMFVISREKKELVAMAQKVAQLGADASPEAVRQARADLRTLVDKVLAPE